MTAVNLSVVQYSTAKGIIYVELCSWWDMTHLFKKKKKQQLCDDQNSVFQNKQTGKAESFVWIKDICKIIPDHYHLIY